MKNLKKYNTTNIIPHFIRFSVCTKMWRTIFFYFLRTRDEMRLRDNMKKGNMYVEGIRRGYTLLDWRFEWIFFCFHLGVRWELSIAKRKARRGRVNGINTWSLPPHPMCSHIFLSIYICEPYRQHSMAWKWKNYFGLPSSFDMLVSLYQSDGEHKIL